MGYIKLTWVNNETPLTADNLNHIEVGVELAHSLIEELQILTGGHTTFINSNDIRLNTIEGRLDTNDTDINTINNLLSGLRIDTDISTDKLVDLASGTYQVEEILLPNGVRIGYNTIDQVIEFKYPNGEETITRKIHSKLGLLADVTITDGAVEDILIRKVDGTFENVSKENFLSDTAKLSRENTFAEAQTFTKQSIHKAGINLDNQKIVGLNAGESPNEAINKSQLDALNTSIRATTIMGIDLNDDITRAEIVNAIGEATQSMSGLMSPTDKAISDLLYETLGAQEDLDAVVNTLNEMLAIFNAYPEGADLVTALAGKVDKVIGKELSTNDLTNQLKTNYDTAYTHSQITDSNPHQTKYIDILNKPTTLTGFGIKEEVDMLLEGVSPALGLQPTLLTSIPLNNGDSILTSAFTDKTLITFQATRTDTQEVDSDTVTLISVGKKFVFFDDPNIYFIVGETSSTFHTNQNVILKINAFESLLALPASSVSYDGTASGHTATEVQAAIDETVTDLKAHEALTNNPHAVTKTQVGLSNVDNTSDVNKPVSSATQAALDLKSDKTHVHAFSEITTTPTTIAGYGITDAYTKTETNTQISTAIAGVVASSPETLNTLDELSAALGDDPNFATTVATQIGTKVTANTAITGATKTKVTYDSKGLITGGTDAVVADISGLTEALAGKANVIHSHVKADITDFPATMPPSSHTHGNITNDGKVGTTTDQVLVTTTGGLVTTASRSGIDSRATFPATAHTHDDRYYTETETNTLLGGKANTSHTHSSADVTGLQDALNAKLSTSLKGAINGLAELGADGKVPAAQLPSYVDDVLEYANLAGFPATGETGKIYVDLDTNKTYRWSGTAYVVISETLALGSTSSTAHRGDHGSTAYTHSQVTDGSNPHNTTFANLASKPTTISGYGITNAMTTSHPANSITALKIADWDNAYAWGDHAAVGYLTSVPVTSVNTKTGVVSLTYDDVGASPAGHSHSWTAITDKPTTFTPSSHVHGNITNDGKIGTTTNLVVTTTTGGLLTTSSRSGIDSRSTFPPSSHTHLWADITDKPSTFTPSAHTHAYADLTGIPSTFTPSAHTHAYADLTGIPSTFTPSAHGHGNITNAGAIGVTNDLVVVTGTSGVLTTASRNGIDSRASFPPSTHDHTFASLTAKPSTISGYGITDAYTKTETDTAISTAVSGVIDAAPGTLDTLNELAAALGDDPNFATSVATSISTKANNSVTISAGSGLSGGGNLTTDRTISHADTSTQASVAASGRRYITAITLDTFGHVTALSTGTETVVNTDTNTTYSVKASTQTGGAGLDLDAGGSGSGTDTVIFKGAGATTVSYTDANTITIGSTDTNTTYGAMTSTVYGLGKLFSDTAQSVAANAVSATASRTYGIQANASGQLVVNVPWVDTNTVYTHPTYSLTQAAGTETTLADITLIDSLTTNSTGHLTGATWRKLVAGSNVTITPAADGNITISSTDTNTVYTHPTYNRSDTTSTASPAHGGTFTVVDSVSATNGHVTAVNLKTITLPGDNDTHWTSKNIVGASGTATANATATNGNVHLNHLEGSTVTSAHKIIGSGATTVVSDASGNITISSTDNNTLNTAGSTDTSSKIFLVGATSQAANPQTYSDNEVFATNGVLNAKTFTSTVATGTAPLTVNSTTAVANLQAATATKLHTTRAITVGPTAKNFDGSAAITYTLAEIGINVVTTCPTGAGTAGRVNIYTGAACATKYANWLYFET